MIRRAAQISILLILAIGGTYCTGNTDVTDHILFGLTIRDGADASTSPAVSCASEIAVTTTQIDLVEDGNVTRSYSTTSPFYTDAPATLPNDGLISVETCVYLMNAFNGTVEIPLSENATYAGRVNVRTSFPVAASGNWPGSNQVLPTKLVFTGDGTTGHGTASRQCFTIAKVNTGVDPKESAHQVILGEITSGDNAGLYTGKNACDVSATVEDDDGPGVKVTSISRIMEEPGGTGFTNAYFAVNLRTAPTADVTIPINDVYDATNAANREGVASPTSLTFTTANWATPQNVTITSQDDLEVDGTKTYLVGVSAASSSDSVYNGFEPRDVIVINNDKSVPGYTYTLWDTTTGNTTSSTAGTVNGFATDEMGNLGNTYATFNIKLRSKPSATVTLNFTSNNPAVSTVQTPTLVFTTSNWNVDQAVTVIGKSDGVDGGSGNGNVDYNVTFTSTTTDGTYSTIPRPTFAIRSCDNDNTHLIQACNFSGAPFGDTRGRLSAAEGGSTATWFITKTSPGSAITVSTSSTDTTEGTVPASVTIDSGNYNTLSAGGANRLALTHVDDSLLDGSVNWTVTTAAATGGSTYNTYDPLATTTDNEQRYYINVTGSTQEGSATQATVDICLGADNTGTVTIDAGSCTGECGTITNQVTFAANKMITAGTPSNAACSSDPNRQTFYVTGGDDTYADGTVAYSVTFTNTTSSDATFNGQNPGSQSINNADDEPPGKAIFVTGPQIGEMTLAGVGGADNYCTTGKPGYAPSGTYKALIVSNASPLRVATTDGSTSAGQVSWVLTAGNYYYRCESGSCSDQASHMFVANSAGLIPFAMDLDFSSTGSDEFWTGMNGNMTPATQPSTPPQGADPAYRDNCAGWTYKEGPNSPFNPYFAQTWTKNALGTVTSNTDVSCSLSKKIICVQQ